MRRYSPTTVLGSALILLVSPQLAYAYVDPGAGSLLLQLLRGGVAGVLLIGKVYWRRVSGLLGFREKKGVPGGQEKGYEAQE